MLVVADGGGPNGLKAAPFSFPETLARYMQYYDETESFLSGLSIAHIACENAKYEALGTASMAAARINTQ